MPYELGHCNADHDNRAGPSTEIVRVAASVALPESPTVALAIMNADICSPQSQPECIASPDPNAVIGEACVAGV